MTFPDGYYAVQVPFAEPDIGEAEEEAVLAVLRRKWLTAGQEVRQFEIEFANVVGTTHAIAVANCSLALQLSLTAVGVRPGDEVIVPSLSFVASVAPVLHCGAFPVFADIVGENDLNLSVSSIAAAITDRTRAIVVLHYGGFPIDMTGLRRLADARDIALIEDAAHAHGSSLDGRACGGLGDVGCFSFYSNKNMTTGEGGMITTNDDESAAELRILRNQGTTTSLADRHAGRVQGYDVQVLGMNARMDELRAAIGRVQLRKLAGNNARRARSVNAYRERLKGFSMLGLPFSDHRGISAHHLMPVLLPAGYNRERLVTRLREQGIQTSVHYRPIHSLSFYSERYSQRLPMTDAVAPRLLSLPLFPGITSEAIDKVCAALERELR